MRTALRLLLLACPFAVGAQLTPVAQTVPPASVKVSELMPKTFQPQPLAGPLTGKFNSAPAGRTMYRWSLVSLAAANGADAISSWRQQEANPLVAGGATQFGGSSLMIKSGFVVTSLVIQQIVLRHRPDLYKKLAWLNFGTAGVLGGVAYHNMGIR